MFGRFWEPKLSLGRAMVFVPSSIGCCGWQERRTKDAGAPGRNAQRGHTATDSVFSQQQRRRECSAAAHADGIHSVCSGSRRTRGGWVAGGWDGVCGQCQCACGIPASECLKAAAQINPAVEAISSPEGRLRRHCSHLFLRRLLSDCPRGLSCCSRLN